MIRQEDVVKRLYEVGVIWQVYGRLSVAEEHLLKNGVDGLPRDNVFDLDDSWEIDRDQIFYGEEESGE